MLELAKIPFPEVARLAQGGRALTILPVGVVEEHGAHLPLGMDSFAAEAYAAAVAAHLEDAGYEVVVAPTINYGVARAAIDFPGTLSLEPETLCSMVVEIGRSLARHGFKRLVILNGHRDLHHMKALDDARGTLIHEKPAQVLCVGFASDPAMTSACYREGVRQYYQSPRPDREGHGGESETSVALHCFPDLVDKDVLKQLDPNFDYDVEAFRNETKDYGSISGGRGFSILGLLAWERSHSSTGDAVADPCSLKVRSCTGNADCPGGAACEGGFCNDRIDTLVQSSEKVGDAVRALKLSMMGESDILEPQPNEMLDCTVAEPSLACERELLQNAVGANLDDPSAASPAIPSASAFRLLCGSSSTQKVASPRRRRSSLPRMRARRVMARICRSPRWSPASSVFRPMTSSAAPSANVDARRGSAMRSSRVSPFSQ